MSDRWALRSTSDDLRRRYLSEGHWTDDTLGRVLADAVADHPDLDVRVWSAQRASRSTTGDVLRRAGALAAGLAERGVHPGDVVAFQLPNWEEAVVTFAGLALLGAVIVPVVDFYGPKELGYILEESGATTLVTAERFRHLDYLAGLDEIRPRLARLERVIVVAAGDGPLPAGVEAFDRVVDTDPIDGPVDVDPDTPAVVAYTSGTTANPKGVIHTHRSLLAEVRQLSAIQYPTHRPTLVGAPVAHAIGMLSGVLLPIYRGLGIHLTDRWDPERVLAAMLEDDLTAGSGSTVFLVSLLDAPSFTPEHAAKMEWAGLGGAPVPEAVAERAEALGILVTRVYGATEQPSITGSMWDAPRRERTATDGRPLAGVEVRLLDESGREVGPGEPGEIHSRGPDLFAGYTDHTLTDAAVDGDGWYATGDIGVLDDSGCLTITDRRSDIIIRGGTNISAAEVEELLVRLPGTSEVAVVAAPDERLGEHACAFVRMQPGASPPDLPALRTHLERMGLGRPKWPEEVRVVDDFPRTPSGKIKKFELRAALRSEHPEVS